MQFNRWPKWKLMLMLLLIAAIIILNVYCLTHARADEEIPCWILCQPDSWVNARMNPTKKSQELGRLECGDMVYTDGVVKNGFLHVIDLNFEMAEGWVHKGYVVYDEPYRPYVYETTIQSNGRVSARKTINGERRCWLKDGQKVKVYMMSAEWSVTNKGFVKSEFIDTGR